MKKNTFFYLSAVVFFISSAIFAVDKQAALRIGYADTERIMLASIEYKEIDREARYKIELKEEEGQQKLDALKKLANEISELSEEKRKPLIREYRRKQEDLAVFQQQTKDEVLERQSVDLKRIANKIKRSIEEISRDMNMTVVFDLKPILYLDRTQVTDLTDKVIEALNKEYEEEKQKLRKKMPLPKRIK
ncbi:MAG: hypothetical protein DRI44_07250 [Chlamydiae bacterium]|nr:MAG: hypothetical protein DRI44_07250 [Chlamydiota bacterium]